MTDSEAYQKNTKEAYEALGRFVEAFEMMVDSVRSICIALLGPNLHSNALPDIVLHHQAMSAKPLFDILRAMIAEIVKEHLKDDEHERNTFAAVLAHIAKAYSDLTNMRNNLLHGTWFIGSASVDDEDAAEFYVKKHTATKEGLGTLELPRKPEELAALTDECVIVRDWIRAVESCLPVMGDWKIKHRFKQNPTWDLRPMPEFVTLLQKLRSTPAESH
jgi:hypothetical protein